MTTRGKLYPISEVQTETPGGSFEVRNGPPFAAAHIRSTGRRRRDPSPRPSPVSTNEGHSMIRPNGTGTMVSQTLHVCHIYRGFKDQCRHIYGIHGASGYVSQPNIAWYLQFVAHCAMVVAWWSLYIRQRPSHKRCDASLAPPFSLAWPSGAGAGTCGRWVSWAPSENDASRKSPSA